MRSSCYGFLLALILGAPVFGQETAGSASSGVTWGSLEVGAQVVAWTSSYVEPIDGSEVLTPLTLSAFPWKGVKIYAQSEYADGNYTPSEPTETVDLSHLSDTVLGADAEFTSFSLPSLVNVAFNLPTGDTTWEDQQSNSVVPTEFVDSDYRGRGFGISALYGISFPNGKEQYGVAAGYLYNGAFNPYYGQTTQLKLGDSVFISLNRIVDHGNGQSDVIRLSGFYFFTTQQDSANLLQLGPNLNASYGWSNPKAFSFELGAQYFFPTQDDTTGQSENALGARFYLNPSYAFGDFNLAGQVKYVLANGYAASDALYDGGGYLLGLQPSYLVKLDSTSSLKFSAGFDYIFAQDAAATATQAVRANVEYARWTLGTDYEVSL